MNANQNSRTSGGSFVTYVFILAGLVGLFYLYQYLFGEQSRNMVTLLGSTQKSDIDPGQAITIPSSSLSSLYEGGEFTVSMWVYIQNWNYRLGRNKHILSIGGQNFDTIQVYLAASKNQLKVRFHTREGGNATSSDNHTDLRATNKKSTFTELHTDSGLLDSVPICDIPDIDLQRCVNIAIAVNGKTVDVYLDGKLARSCVLPAFYKVDGSGYSANLLQYGGFGGQISNVTMYNYAVNPEVAHKNYMAGPQPITGFLDYLKSFFDPKSML